MKTQAEADALLAIKTVADLQELEVLNEYTDDHQQCAEVKVNGIRVDFMWWDNLAFLYYAKDSPTAFAEFVENLHHTVKVDVENEFQFYEE